MTTDLVQVSPYRFGQRVRENAFTDCFGEHHPAVDDLIITALQWIWPVNSPRDPWVLKPYLRITAERIGPGSVRLVEASARFFSLPKGGAR